MLSRPSGRSYWQQTQVLSHCWTLFDWADAESALGSRVKICALIFLKYNLRANTRKKFGSDEQTANREQPITSKRHTNFNMDLLLQWITFRKTELWKQSFESSNVFWKEVSFQNRLGCCSSQFKFVAWGKQDVQSLIDPIVQTRESVLFET